MGTQSITFEIPIPHKTLSPNARAHWRTTSKHKKHSRTLSYLAALRHSFIVKEPWPGKECIVEATWHGRTASCLRMDDTNARGSLKAAEDGITDAGVWDNDKGVRWEPIKFAVDKNNPRVTITVKHVGAAQ